MIENKYPRELRISQSQLVDYLFHAATCEDIAAVRQENLAMHQDSKSDIADLRQDFKSEMLAMRQDFKSENISIRQSIKDEIVALRHETITQHKLEIRTILGVGVTIVGVMIGVANFLTHFLIHTA